MTKSNILTITFFALLTFIGCKEDFYFESERVLTADQWSYQDSLDFTFSIADTSALYNLYLDINHSTEYPYQNVYLNVATLFPSGKRIKERLPIDFADKTGRWYGNCDSEWCKLRVNLQQDAFFNEIGKHTITLEQNMRVNPLPGIRQLSIKLEDTKRKR